MVPFVGDPRKWWGFLFGSPLAPLRTGTLQQRHTLQPFDSLVCNPSGVHGKSKPPDVEYALKRLSKGYIVQVWSPEWLGVCFWRVFCSGYLDPQTTPQIDYHPIIAGRLTHSEEQFKGPGIPFRVQRKNQQERLHLYGRHGLFALAARGNQQTSDQLTISLERSCLI